MAVMLSQVNMNPEELIDDIYRAIKDDSAFAHLRTGASNPFVPGEGAYEDCKAFILGEAPGAYEAVKRKPFVGPAGKVQRELMGFAGLRTEDEKDDGWDSPPTAPANCWLTNVLRYRPPRNRRPTTLEIKASRKYIRREWMAVGSPKLIIPVGGAALEAVLGRSVSILKVSGKPMLRSTHGGIKPWVVTLWPMIHPSYGLRNKAVQPLIERDWMALAKWMKDHAL